VGKGQRGLGAGERCESYRAVAGGGGGTRYISRLEF